MTENASTGTTPRASERGRFPDGKVSVVIRSVRLRRLNGSGDVWDKSGAPDPKVEVEEVGGNDQSYVTPAAQDTHHAKYELSAFRVPMNSQIRITVYDEDVFEDDFAGSTTAIIDSQAVDGKELQLSFGGVDSLVLSLRRD